MTDPTQSAQVNQLPEPASEEKQRSLEVVAAVGRACREQGGAISFGEYMRIALYEPGVGYYCGGLEKFGAGGDFVTAPEVSPLFAQCIARQVAQVTEKLDCADVLEFGAGSGAMAVELVLELERIGCPPVRYRIVELSAELRRRQRERVRQRVGHLLERFEWLDALPDRPINGVIVANEVLDAMPVECFRLHRGALEQLYVVSAGADRLRTEYRPANDEVTRGVRVIEERRGAVFAREGFASEFNPALGGWLSGLRQVLQHGLVLLIDYGYPVREYYLDERDRGTLICHYRHRAHADPMWYPGIQDITAFVDFSAVAHAAVDAGFRVDGYTSQAFFLMGCGLADLHARYSTNDPGTQLRLSQQVKTLTLPSEMGERFKAMALTVGIDEALVGFSLQDYRNRL